MVRLPVSPMSLPNKYWPFYTNASEMKNMCIWPAVRAILKEFPAMSLPIA